MVRHPERVGVPDVSFPHEKLPRESCVSGGILLVAPINVAHSLDLGRVQQLTGRVGLTVGTA